MLARRPPHQLVDDRDHRRPCTAPALDAFGHQLVDVAGRRPGNSGRPRPAASRPASPCRGRSCTSAPGTGSISPGASSVPANRRAEHHRVGTGGDRLGDVARVADAAVGDQRHAAAAERRGDVADRGDLRHADAGDDARGADRARADADLDAVGAARRPAPRAASAVAMLPPITCDRRVLALDPAHPLEHALRSGRARCRRRSRRRRPRPAARRAPRCRRRRRSPRRRAACPARPCRRCGCSVALRMSLTVIRPRSSKASLTTSTRSSRCRCISALASSSVAPSRTVTRRSRGVMMWLTGWSRLRLEAQVAVGDDADHLAARRPPAGRRSGAAGSGRSRRAPSSCGEIVIGSLTTPALEALDLGHLGGLCAGARFLWTMPMPPSWAMAIARRASVTVSMAADTQRDVQADVAASGGSSGRRRGEGCRRTREPAGRRRTSAPSSPVAWDPRAQMPIIQVHPQRSARPRRPAFRRRASAAPQRGTHNRGHRACTQFGRSHAMSKPRSLPGVIAVAGLLFALPALADSWQWRDAAGRMVYSDLPPPAEVRAAQILRSPTHRSGRGCTRGARRGTQLGRKGTGVAQARRRARRIAAQAARRARADRPVGARLRRRADARCAPSRAASGWRCSISAASAKCSTTPSARAASTAFARRSRAVAPRAADARSPSAPHARRAACRRAPARVAVRASFGSIASGPSSSMRSPSCSRVAPSQRSPKIAVVSRPRASSPSSAAPRSLSARTASASPTREPAGRRMALRPIEPSASTQTISTRTISAGERRSTCRRGVSGHGSARRGARTRR